MASHGELTGAWVRLDWATPQTIERLRLYDRINSVDQVVAGTVELSDGTALAVGPLPNDGATPVEVSFAPRAVSWLRFRIDRVSASTYEPGLAELEAFALVDEPLAEGGLDAGLDAGGPAPTGDDGGVLPAGDAGVPPAEAGGCACSLTRDTSPPWGGFLLLAWMLWRSRAREGATSPARSSRRSPRTRR